MKEVGIAICDDEKEYALCLMEYLRSKGVPYEIEVFFSPERLLENADTGKVALLIIAESELCGNILNRDFPQMLILSESGRCLGGEAPVLSKYQSMEIICDSVLRLCLEAGKREGAPVPASIRHGNPMKIMGVYSPLSRVLQTTVSIAAGEILSTRYRTLYMNFENFSGLDILLNRHFRGSVSDLLYFNECAREKFSSQMALMVEHLNGLDVLPPMHSFIELRSIRADQWQELFRTIEQVTEYEWLILDLSESTDGLLDILRSCRQVITLTRPDCFISEAKMQQYRSILQDRGYEDVYAKTKQWRMPVFRELPSDFADMTHGELAAALRSLLSDMEGGI